MTTAANIASRHGSHPHWDQPVRLTPLYHEHLAHGASMSEREGWILPRSYGDVSGEIVAVRNGVGLLDRSEVSKFDLKGDEIEETLRAALPAMENVGVGQTARASDDTRVYCLTEDEALVITTPKEAHHTLHALNTAAGRRTFVHVVDLTSARCSLRLLGTRAPAMMQRISALDLAPDRFTDGAVIQGAVARVHALVARRDTAGLTGYDLYVDRDLGAYLWATLLEIGAPLALQPVGREAMEGLA